MATQFLVAEARRIYLGGLTNCSFLLPFRWKEEEEEEEENFLPTLFTRLPNLHWACSHSLTSQQGQEITYSVVGLLVFYTKNSDSNLNITERREIGSIASRLQSELSFLLIPSALCACMLRHFSHAWHFATLWTVAHQAPLSMGFSKQDYWSGLPFPPPRDLPNLGMQCVSCSGKRILHHCATCDVP